jgi:cobalamin biosynthesis Mg chelatase CobN
MSRLTIVPGYPQISEVRVLCDALRERGLAVLVLTTSSDACYDAFYWCRDVARIDTLYDETRARVRGRFRDPI